VNATRAIGFALLLCAGAGYAEAKKGKTRVSANGLYGIRMVELNDKTCRVDVVREQQAVWVLEKCVGGLDDLYFVSDDGQRFWILYPLPERPDKSKADASPPPRQKGKKARPAVFDVVVAAEYDRQGNPLQMKRLSDFIPDKSLEELRELGKHFKWLGGVFSVPGQPPRLNDGAQGGEVEFETVVGQKFTLKF